MYKEYENGNVAVIEDNAKIDVNTSKGRIYKRKGLLILKNDNGIDYHVLISDLTENEKEEMFDLLDANIHEKFDTNKYMAERIEILENRISDLEETVEEGAAVGEIDGSDCEFDFYEE